MHKGRTEAFSDGVLAIVITIMVLEMKVPHGTTLADLLALAPVFVSYVLSFAYVGIYWSNHHHLFQAVHRVDGSVLWANLHLLFWLSLLPFVTGWMGENAFAPNTVVLYGIVLAVTAVAWTILERRLLHCNTEDSTLARAIGGGRKEGISTVAYLVAIIVAVWAPRLAITIYATVAVVWLVPDRRIERALAG